MSDLIESMKCKNCLNLKIKEGKPYCEEHQKEASLEDSCSIWAENLEAKEEIKEIYEGVKEILKRFMDMKEENNEIISLWIMGTWLHRNFQTYPYLFINAMKGSGKTRLLKLIKTLSWEGDMLTSLSEAVLFRTKGTLCIDEFEDVKGKDKNALRELLNTAYKEGGKVKRMKKKTTNKGEEQVVEEFDTFRPIVMANIWGMEEVLGDRCIPIVLEKSSNKHITRKVENFSTDPLILKIREKLGKTNIWCSLCSVVTQKNIYIDWNNYIEYIYTNYTTNTNYTNIHKLHLFKKIYDTEINGRNLELTFPLLLISEELGILDKFIDIIKKVVEERQEEDIMESRDIMLYDFISTQDNKDWVKVKELTNLFRYHISADVEDLWLTTRWIGRALKRLNLIKEKRRVGEGIEVVLNIDKAQDKMNLFRRK